jgi:hypothetical protein
MPRAPRITLTCLACDREWKMKRRRGQYPRRCPRCVLADRPVPPTARQVAEQLAADAVARGVDAIARWHERRGWSVWARTPWHDERVRLVDQKDLSYLTAELAHHPQEAAA